MVRSINIAGNNITIINGNIVGEESIVGNDTITSEKRSYLPFNSIVTNGPVDILYAPNESGSIQVVCDSNLAELIVTEVCNSILSVSVRGSFQTKNSIQVICASPEINEAHVYGSGNIILNGIMANALFISVHGSGDIEVSGSVRELRASVQGSGDIDCTDCLTRTAELSVDGSGDIAVVCKECLVASVNGSGDIRVKGSPQQVSQSCNGSGSIRVK